jgi:hypothetical protein
MMIERIAYFVIGVALTVTVMTLLPSFQEEQIPAKISENSMLDTMEMHDHPLLPVSADLPVPSVTHLMFSDVMGGFNLQILARNFEFTPAAINRQPEYNSGHAHVYVNGVKYARVYSPWFHLPTNALKVGENFIKVTLNANNHSEWAKDGKAISSVVKIVIPE